MNTTHPQNPRIYTAGALRSILVSKQAKNTSDKELKRCLSIPMLRDFAKQLRTIGMLKV